MGDLNVLVRLIGMEALAEGALTHELRERGEAEGGGEVAGGHVTAGRKR